MKAHFQALVLLLISLFADFATADTNRKIDQFVAYPKGQYAFINVQLIDGTGSKLKTQQTVLVDNEQITAVGPTAKVKVSPHYKIIDLKNRTIIPGIVGVHNHLHIPGHNYNADNIAKLYLASGVTSIQTVGAAFAQFEIKLANDIGQGIKLGPEIIPSAPYFTGPQGNPNMLHSTDEKTIATQLKYWKEQGASWVKVYRNIELEQFKTITKQAEKLGMFVTGHLCSITFEQASTLGINGIQHGLNSASDFRRNKSNGKCDGRHDYMDTINVKSQKVKRLQQTMIDNEVFLTSTLSIYESSVIHRSQVDKRAEDIMSVAMLNRYQKRIQENLGKVDKKREKRLKRIMSFDRQFYQMGGLLGAGSDAGRFLLPGFGDQQNLILLVEAGFTVEEAINVMTLNGAKIIKRPDIGQITSGKRADFVVLDGDLSEDTGAIKRVVSVFQKGIGYSSNKIIASLKRKIGNS